MAESKCEQNMHTTKLKILYNIPSLETVYAARFIYEGYKDAFLKLGYEFRSLTSADDPKKILETFKPDIFISSLNPYTFKFLNLELLKKYRKKGLVYFNQIGLWNTSINQFGGEALKNNNHYVKLIKKGLLGDVFFNWHQQDDPAMDGFTKTTGYPFQTILLAANTKKYYYEYSEKYQADISYVGSLLPDKKEFIKKHVFPLMKKHNVKVYGSDWTFVDRTLGYGQKIGQYFNIDFLKKVRSIKLPMDDERKVYSSSTISLNIHESHQRLNGKDFNERTFKIIASGGFEICDNVKVLRKYFNEKELIIGKNTEDWFEKIEFYLKHPEKRISVIKAGKKKILSEHTYNNRVKQIISIYKKYI